MVEAAGMATMAEVATTSTKITIMAAIEATTVAETTTTAAGTTSVAAVAVEETDGAVDVVEVEEEVDEAAETRHDLPCTIADTCTGPFATPVRPLRANQGRIRTLGQQPEKPYATRPRTE